jgi:hypothetical protein
MKAYTDIEQSKKLAEILPVESADMYYLNRHIDLAETKYEIFVVDKSNKYIDFFNSYAVAIEKHEIIPAWSLAALLDVLPEVNDNKPAIFLNDNSIIYPYVCDLSVKADNLIDACVAMILKLHELKML